MIKIDLPDKAFWLQLGVDEGKEIRQRTEDRGIDAKGDKFKPYSKAYAAYRAAHGLTTMTNLSFTANMLGAIARGIEASDDRVKITLSGGEGLKAWSLENRDLEFLGVPEDRAQLLAEKYGNEVLTRISITE